MAGGRLWQDGEIVALKELWPYFTSTELALYFDRTPDALRIKAKELQIQKPPEWRVEWTRTVAYKHLPTVSPMAWSDIELAFLKEHYPQKGREWCAEHLLGRTKSAIIHKAFQLKLCVTEECFSALVSKARLGKPLSAEHKAAIGATKRRLGLHKGPKNPQYGTPSPHGKGGWYQTLDGQRIWMRSSWELKFATYLSKHGFVWLYEPHRFVLPSGTYSPDFLLPSTGVYLEVKGYLYPKDARKLKEFKQCYPDKQLVLVDEFKMRELGLI